MYSTFHSPSCHFHLIALETANVIIPGRQNDSELIKDQWIINV